MSYSTDLRTRVIDYVKGGGSKAEAARRFGVGRHTVYRWLKQPVARRPGPRAPRVDTVRLRAHVLEKPDMYLAERAKLFGMTPSGMCRALKRLNLLKKNVVASES